MQKFISLSYSWAENLRNPAVIKQVLLTFSVCSAVYQWNFNKRQFNLSNSAKNANACSFLWFKVIWWLDIVQGQRGQLLSENRAQQSTFFKKKKKIAIKPEFSQTSEHMAIFLVFSVFLVVVVLVAMVWERSLWVSKGRYLYDIGGFLLIQVAFKILFQFQSRGWCLYLLALLEDWKQRLKQFHESENEYVWFKSDHVFLLL